MKIKDKIKRLSALLCAVVVGTLSCIPAFASHIPTVPTSEYITFYADTDVLTATSIDDIYDKFGFDNLPFTTYHISANTGEYSTYNLSTVEDWFLTHSDVNEIIIYSEDKSGNIHIQSFVYDINEVNVIYDGTNIIMTNNTLETVNFVNCGMPSFVKTDVGYSASLSYSAFTSLGNLTTSTTYKYPNNSNYTTLKIISSNADIYDSLGNLAIEKEVMPEPWQYVVTYTPILSDNMADIKEIAVNVSLADASIKYCEKNYMQVDILPFVSTTSANDSIVESFDNAKAVIPTKSNYLDGYTLASSNSAVGGTHGGYWTFDKAYGNNVLYTLSAENNYTLTLTMPITSTPLVSNTDYYFNVVAVQHNYLLSHSSGNTPYRHAFKYVYENGETNLLDLEVMSAEKFTFSSVLKKTDNKNGVGEGGLIMSTTNSLNSTPSTVNPYGTDNYISYGEIDEYNESVKEEYYPNYNNGSGFDTSSLDGLFESSSGFFDFLKQGFSILPSFIWLLIGGFITVLIFLRVMGR